MQSRSSSLESRVDIVAVFTDIDMPGSMNGLRLAAAIRDHWPPIKLVVTSGNRRPEPQEMPTGVPFLAKPYPATAMVSSLRTLLET